MKERDSVNMHVNKMMEKYVQTENKMKIMRNKQTPNIFNIII